MIRISKMADYGVVILTALARHPQTVMSAASLAQETHLPEPTVSKVLKSLSKGNIVRAVRGINGGYTLRGAAKEISMAQVITAIDGPIALVACADGQTPDCSLTHVCGLRGRWDDVNAAIREALENVSLSDMVPTTKAQMKEAVHGRH